MKQLIGCCGLDCEKCGAYIATVNNDDEMRKQTAKLWSEWNNTEIPPEAINCTGCRTESANARLEKAMQPAANVRAGKTAGHSRSFTTTATKPP